MTGIKEKEISMPLSEFVDNSLIYIVDDVTKVTAKDVVEDFRLDLWDEGIEEEYVPTGVKERITVSKSDVKKTIRNLNTQAYMIPRYYKTVDFMKERSLDEKEIHEAVKKLSVEDYTYSIYSKHPAHLGDILDVFVVKNKNFGNSKLDNLIIYIKVDAFEKQKVTIISFHEAERDGSDLKPYKESMETIKTLSDFIDNSIVVFTNDIDSVDVKDIVNGFKNDSWDEDIKEDIETPSVKNYKITLSKSDVEKALSDLQYKGIVYVDRDKNSSFKNERGLTRKEIIEAIKKLSTEDYSYSLESSHFLYPGHILNVFVTKNDLGNEKLSNLILYIKIDTYENEYVTIISFHEAERDESSMNPYKESIFETLNEDLDEQIKVIFKCSLYQGNSLKPANLENIDLDMALRSVIAKDLRNFIDKFNAANNLNLDNEAEWTRYGIDIDDTNLDNTKLAKVNLFDNENNIEKAEELLKKSGDFSNSMILLDDEDGYHTFTITYKIVDTE